MLVAFLSAIAALISVVNPIGAIPIYLAMTTDETKLERRQTALRTSMYFFAILIVFFFAGVYILNFFGISISSMRIAGGIVIFQSGFSLLSGEFSQSRGMNKKVRAEAMEKEDISFSPMAMPILSGPGSISLLISWYTVNDAWTDKLMICGVVFVAAFLVFLTLRSAPILFKVLGRGGLKAISRIMGFIVMSIAVQYIISGIYELVISFRELH